MELLAWCRLHWDRALGFLLMATGFAFLIVGWVGVSGTEFVAEQVPYALSGGLGGALLVVTGCTLWISAYLSDEWSALERVRQEKSVVEDLALRVSLLEAERPGAREPQRQRAEA